MHLASVCAHDARRVPLPQQAVPLRWRRGFIARAYRSDDEDCYPMALAARGFSVKLSRSNMQCLCL